MTQISDDILIRFFNNDCTDDELIAIKNWLEEDEANAERLFELEQMVMAVESMHTDDRLRKNISDKISMRQARVKTPLGRRTSRTAIRWAAAVAVLFAVAFIAAMFMRRQPEVKIIHIAATSSSRSVVLPDSTVVYLNRNSTLSYPERYVSGLRQVSLRGEGYFEVTKDSKHPFIVNGQYLSVEVLGTRFNFISRDSGDNSVSLVDGSVEVSAASLNESVILVPGQKANYDIATGDLTVCDTKPAIDAAWHNHIIPFENVNIRQICDILVQLYGVQIDLDSGVNLEKTYSGATVYYDEIDSTLVRLGYTLPIDYTRTQDGFLIMSRN